MRIGVPGSGLMGAKLGTLFTRAGHKVVFSYARSRKKLEGLARDAGGNARAGRRAPAGRALVVAHTSSGAEALAEKVRRAPVVAAFGTVPSDVGR